MKYKGAQPEQFIAKPSVEQFKHYQEAAHGHIRYVTLATEQDDNFELTRYLTSAGYRCQHRSQCCHLRAGSHGLCQWRTLHDPCL